MLGRITIIGLGLIGSSIARAAHAQKLAKTIVGCDADKTSLEYARKEGFITEAALDPAKAVADSDLVILATPPLTLEKVAKAIAPALKAGVIVMDVCSVKQPAIEAITPHLPQNVFFIPAHPIAGSERAGVQAGRADLFEGKRVIVTPEQGEQTPELAVVMQFWKVAGAQVEAMPAALHDLAYAYVSHLPQLLAFAAAPLAEGASPKFLRLGNSPLAMWENIFELNKDNILKALDRYLDVISHIKNELEQAPEPVGEPNEKLVHAVLFPRIAASCLITTVMEAEKQAGFSMARYGGSGFADFTSPAAAPPDQDIEFISGQHAAVAALLEEYATRLKAVRDAIISADVQILKQALAQ